MSEPRYYEPFDAAYMRDLVEEVFDPLFIDAYFRPRLLGAHRLPDKGPLILAPNHSGNAFPFDAMVLDGLLWSRQGRTREAKIRSVFERELATTWWMRPWGIDNFWRRGGGVDLTFDNFDHLLARGERILYYPEGVPGIGKGFNNRYQLQRFSTSFILLGARHQAPIYPTYIVNAEWIIPFNYTFKPVDWLVQKLFGVPFIPLPAAPITLLLPWTWYLALPTRMVFVVGEPLDVAAMVREAGIDLDNPDRAKLQGVAEQVRQHMQAELDRYVGRYGQHPYQWRLLKQRLARSRRRGLLHKAMPWTWAVTFVRHFRDRRRPPAKNKLHRWLRDWDLVSFYLPLGWFLLALTRRLRRPPYGYRGLKPDVRKQQEGAFLWKLEERPLPPRD